MDAKSPRKTQARIAYLSAIVTELKVRYKSVKHRLNRLCKKHNVSYFELAAQSWKPRCYNEMTRLSNYIHSCWAELTKLVCPKHPVTLDNLMLRDALKEKTSSTAQQPNNQFGQRASNIVELKEDGVPIVFVSCEARQYYVRLENRISELEASQITVKRKNEDLERNWANYVKEFRAKTHTEYESKLDSLRLENNSLKESLAGLQSKLVALNATASAPRKVKPRRDKKGTV